MNGKSILLIALIVLLASSITLAERQLNKDEINQIITKLTDQPQKTWISTGTIEAFHREFKAAKTRNENQIQQEINLEILEYKNNNNRREKTAELQADMLAAIPFNVRYKMSNEYTMNSTVVVKYDGERFYWDITIVSREDSVPLPDDLVGNYMTRYIDVEGNRRRIFCWDGQKYTTYTPSTNLSMVDTTNTLPRGINGPLTAGIIPWGYGYFSYESLSKANISAIETSIGRQAQINLSIQNSDGSEMLITLDPARDYTTTSWMIANKNSTTAIQYSRFILISGNWNPTNISIDKYDTMGNLTQSDSWTFTSVTDQPPASSSYSVDYKVNTLIERTTDVAGKTVVYNYSPTTDIEPLLAARLTYATAENQQSQNCATAALKYATLQLGEEVSDLSQLVSGSNQTTTLYAMRKFAQDEGFNCQVVRTDLQTLKNLSDCKAILHIPQKDHLVLLDHIDDQYVWITDTSSRKFFYSIPVSSFTENWSEGTALLISSQPIQPQGGYALIADSQLHNMVGAGFSCTMLVQEYDYILCQMMGGLCFDYFTYFYERYACEPAPTGYCENSRLYRLVETPCINYIYNPLQCTVTYELFYQYMWACNDEI